MVFYYNITDLHFLHSICYGAVWMPDCYSSGWPTAVTGTPWKVNELIQYVATFIDNLIHYSFWYWFILYSRMQSLFICSDRHLKRPMPCDSRLLAICFGLPYQRKHSCGSSFKAVWSMENAVCSFFYSLEKVVLLHSNTCQTRLSCQFDRFRPFCADICCFLAIFWMMFLASFGL